jgi:hypothetical protein
VKETLLRPLAKNRGNQSNQMLLTISNTLKPQKVPYCFDQSNRTANNEIDDIFANKKTAPKKVPDGNPKKPAPAVNYQTDDFFDSRGNRENKSKANTTYILILS